MNRKIHALAAVAALTLAGGAIAQQGQGVPGVDVDANVNADMMGTDTNSDGKISKSEAASNKDLAKQFDKLDANKDGNLSQPEFAKFEASGSAGSKDEKSNPDKKGTDDSVPGNEDKLGPGR
jgi:hypothetical protein